MATRLRLPAFGRALPWGLAALSLVLAFGQRHGRTYTDTRVELTVDPGLFLDRVASVWSPTPGPRPRPERAVRRLPVPDGAVLRGRGRARASRPGSRSGSGWARCSGSRAGARCCSSTRSTAAGAARLTWSPPSSTWPTPTSSCRPTARPRPLLAYAALPWILLAAHRGLSEPRALALAGGARARRRGQQRRDERGHRLLDRGWRPRRSSSTRSCVLRARRADAIAFAWRAALLAALASAWWIVPALIQSKQGPDFLAFTEQPSAIWSTTQHVGVAAADGLLALVLRDGLRRVAAAGVSSAVRPLPDQRAGDRRHVRGAAAGASAGCCLHPALALCARSSGCSPWAPCWSWPPAIPDGKPAAGTLEAIYYKVAGHPVPAHHLQGGPAARPRACACLAGAAARELWRSRPGSPGRRAPARAGAPPRPLFAAAGGALRARRCSAAGSSSRPSPTARSRRVARRPGDAARATPDDRRIMVLPGQLFGAYRWGADRSTLRSPRR